MGRELEGELAPTAGAAGGSDEGGVPVTRRRVALQLEELRAMVLVKLLQVLPARARPKWAWRVRDKGSAQWVLSLPGAGRTLSRAELQEVVGVVRGGHKGGGQGGDYLPLPPEPKVVFFSFS